MTTDTSDQAAPALSLEDQEAIRALVNEYAYLLDHGRWADVPSLFTEDSVLRVRGHKFSGPDGLQAWIEYREFRKGRRTLHQVTNVRLEPTGPDRVAGTVGIVLYAAKANSRDSYVDLVGEYRDEYVRTRTGWRFLHRALVELADD